MIDISLFSNHSPSEWFSEYKKPRMESGAPSGAGREIRL